MALTGELSDLSLAELIEFFCNQRKTGRLKVIYPIGPGYFYLQAGSVVHARIGELRGIEAVYCALTLSNASFTFSPAFEAPEHTINQPWTSVVLEGLRRMDEGIFPSNPFPEDNFSPVETVKAAEPEEGSSLVDQFKASEPKVAIDVEEPAREMDDPKNSPIALPIAAPVPTPAFRAEAENESRRKMKPWTVAAVVFAVLLVLAGIAVPWGMYARNKAARQAAEPGTLPAASAETSATSTEAPLPAPTPDETVVPPTNSADAEQFAKRQREARARERAKAQEGDASALTSTVQPPATSSTSSSAIPNSPKAQSSPAPGKKVTVQVTYDENGRVTQASGGDANALRIARQKRFPAGKGGSATVTIPIN
jgi:uncharacterized protein DUF4388